MPGALEGIRVLDVGLLVQGPQAGALLCDLGADVIKIELPEVGDPARWIMVNEDDPRGAYFNACNRGKRSVTLDLRTPSGVAIFRRLAEAADVIISNFRPGTMEAWGLGYEALRAVNPGIIWAAGSTFGVFGPDAEREGADLSGQAAGGLVSTIGHDGEPPTPVGATIADHCASQNLAAGILAALVSRARTGEGQRVDVSLLGGQIWAQASEYTHFLLTDEVPGRGTYGHPLLRGLYGLFRTKDGWIGLIGVPLDAQDAFFIAIEHPELALDARYSGLLLSRAEMREMFELLNSVFETKTTYQWGEILTDAGVRWAPVRNYRDVAADPGAWENGYFVRLDDGAGKQTTVVPAPIAMTGTPLQPSGQLPALGEHTAEVLQIAGYSAAEIEGFRAEGAV